MGEREHALLPNPLTTKGLVWVDNARDPAQRKHSPDEARLWQAHVDAGHVIDEPQGNTTYSVAAMRANGLIGWYAIMEEEQCDQRG
jgi:hypothetical protein